MTLTRDERHHQATARADPGPPTPHNRRHGSPKRGLRSDNGDAEMTECRKSERAGWLPRNARSLSDEAKEILGQTCPDKMTKCQNGARSKAQQNESCKKLLSHLCTRGAKGAVLNGNRALTESDDDLRGTLVTGRSIRG